MISTHGYFEGNPSLGLPDTGGQVVFVIELSKALADSGYKVVSRHSTGIYAIQKGVNQRGSA
ncbi:MAG: hypothetical protein E3J66_05395 [Dehalococcoidia bacterium]|nr:MAG: hypothetical protein E3J66_05395 [Dehalococcoidia bacterium]